MGMRRMFRSHIASKMMRWAGRKKFSGFSFSTSSSTASASSMHAARTDCSASMFWGNGLFCGVDCGAKSELRGVLERLSGICDGFLLGALMSVFENSFNRCILPHCERS